MKARERSDVLMYLSFIGVGLAVYLFIVAYPVFYSLWLSITDFNPNRGGSWNFVGLSLYLKMLKDPNFWHSLKNNVIVVLVSVGGQIPIGLLLAYILHRNIVKAGGFFQSFVFLPQFLSTIVVGLLWRRLFSADGPISRLIQFFTGDPAAQFTMMLDANTVMYPIGFALIWMYTGMYMVIFLANLQKIDNSVIEAATIDGASEFQIFWNVIIPHLSGTIIVCSVLAIAGSLRGFDLIFSMTTQGLQRNNAMVLPIFMYQTAFQDYSSDIRFAYGAAISNSIVFISIAFIALSNFIGKLVQPGEEEK